MPRPSSLDPTTDSFNDTRIAILDIGSNSLRLVVYDQLKRAAVPLYNEKVMCQLGKGLATSGVLNPNGVGAAAEAVRRFLALAKAMGAGEVHVMATAAVRDATDGKNFARALEKEHGIRVDIISGEREAKLGAYGICAAIYQPSGISADLGGGSMEVVRLDGPRLMEQNTLPLGPLRLLDQCGGSRGEMRKTIERELKNADWLAGHSPKHFYAIGGSFRAIAKLHMHTTTYPLRILHEYAVGAKTMAEFAHTLAEMDLDKLEKLNGLPTRRANAIPPAAMLLARLLDMIAPEKIVFSGSGIREGYLYEMLPPDLRMQDPLLSACLDMAGRKSRMMNYADELMAWTAPLFTNEQPGEHRLRRAFSLLCELAHHIHPEYRAEWAMERVLFSSFTGITHRERAQLGLALYHRYQYKLRDETPVLKLVNERGRHWARLVGTCGNLSYHVTGGLPGILPRTALILEKKALSLTLSGNTIALAGDAVDRRVSGVAEAYAKWME